MEIGVTTFTWLERRLEEVSALEKIFESSVQY